MFKNEDKCYSQRHVSWVWLKVRTKRAANILEKKNIEKELLTSEKCETKHPQSTETQRNNFSRHTGVSGSAASLQHTSGVQSSLPLPLLRETG